jgi:CheY-like chemotaxis protein
MPAHILLVDDDFLNSHALKDHLEAVGYTVTWAEGCESAAAELRGKQTFDLVILDYLMQDGNGTDLLQLIVREAGFQRPPVVMYSSLIERNDPNWRALLERLPALSQSLIQGYVNKPFPFETIEQVLKETLNRIQNPKSHIAGDYRSTARNFLPKPDAT